jgi:vancomycin resistance protein YoaR
MRLLRRSDRQTDSTADPIDLVDEILGATQPAPVDRWNWSSSGSSELIGVREPVASGPAEANSGALTTALPPTTAQPGPIAVESTTFAPLEPIPAAPAVPIVPDVAAPVEAAPIAGAVDIPVEPSVVARPGPASAPRPIASSAPRRRRRLTVARFILGFAVGTAVVAILLVVAAAAAFSAYSNRVVPGVRVGTVDLSGLTRDQVVARLTTDFAYLDQGEVTITTPTGAATLTFQAAGRGPAVESMADAAMKVGHTGDPLADAAAMLRSATGGNPIDLTVSIDTHALATNLHQLVYTSRVAPRDARVIIGTGLFTVSPSTSGSGLNEIAITKAIIESLTKPDAQASLQAGGAFLTLDPKVSDKDAQNAIDQAERMIRDVTLIWGGNTAAPSPSSSPSLGDPSADPSGNPGPSAGAGSSPGTSTDPTASPSPTPNLPAIPAKTFTVGADTVRTWILFGQKPDGSYGPEVDTGAVLSYVTSLAPKLAIAPVEPKVIYNKSGKPMGVVAGRDGIGIDVSATTDALSSYIESLGSGGATSAVAMDYTPVSPSVTPGNLAGMEIIGNGKGTWTTVFYPDITNGFGANIRTPANLLNGQVIAPGQRFSFLRAVSPIDHAHGYTLGGVIKGGKSDHTGAIGGGICSASTTMFNAAARGGLQIDERHPHYYYITRYPVGLDATVFADGGQVWDLKWTNDTPNPIIIRAWTTYGATSTITIQLWSLPLDRTATFSAAYKANVVQPHDYTVYTTTLKPGQKNRAEYPTVGFDTSRTRTVTDSTGKVIHQDTWFSRYAKVDGLLQIGKAKGSPPTPGPTPTPALIAPVPGAIEAAPSGTPKPRRRAGIARG